MFIKFYVYCGWSKTDFREKDKCIDFKFLRKYIYFLWGKKKESSDMSILVYGIAHQDGVELF